MVFFLGIEVLLLIFYGWMLAASTGAIVALRKRLVFSRASVRN